jgi:O-antigen/teichoic acid export membrane protein
MAVIPILKLDSNTLKARVLSGSAILVAGSALLSVINFGYNLAVARLLGPSAFGHATVVYTLLVVVSAVTLSYQIVCAKVVAQQSIEEAKSQVFRGIHRSSWLCGLGVGILLVLIKNPITTYLKLPGSFLIILLAIGAAFYIPLGACRGYLQGDCDFRRLASNMVWEGALRLVGSLILIVAGLGVTGVIAANAGAVALAYFLALPKLAPITTASAPIRVPSGEAVQAIVFFVGQILIMNSDIIVVKHFFLPAVAGVYAAVALVGRMIFVCSRSVMNSMFPIAAGASARGRRDRSVLTTSLALVLGMGLLSSLLLGLVPAGVWRIFFGAGFLAVESHSISYFLVLYALTTTIYSLIVVVITYEMSYRIVGAGWAQLAFSVLIIAGMYLFHTSLQQVIMIQLILMLPLFVIVTVPFILSTLGKSSKIIGKQASLREVNLVRRVREDEVISEFLKNDFYASVFSKYQESLGHMVISPDLEDVVENALRRALLFVRHGTLWRELPRDTEWFQVELKASDLDNIRVFPRAQWRKLAQGSFGINEICESIASGPRADSVGAEFIAKIRNLRDRYQEQNALGAVLLIGKTENGPFTILDGNHRMVAAILASSETMNDKLRIFCGLSPRMDACCWFETNLTTLFRYGTNLLRYAFHDPVDEINRLLQG